MLITINNTSVRVQFTVGLLANVVQYKKRYEDAKISLQTYINNVASGEAVFDAIVDAIYYQHIFDNKAKGKLGESFSYGDVLAYLLHNDDVMTQLMNDLVDSMPKKDAEADEDVTPKKKVKNLSLNAKT